MIKLKDLKNIPADNFDDEEVELMTKVMIGFLVMGGLIIIGFLVLGYLVVHYQF